MRKRIFIAINLPEGIKRKLSVYQEKWQDLPIKWVKSDNLHITLAFLGNVNDQEILEIDKTVKAITSRHQPFSINLNRICYGPPKKIPPRMVWAQGEKSEKSAKLQTDLEKNLLENFTQYHPAESEAITKRDFSPHITLGRIKAWEWRRIEPEERPEINEDISLSFNVNSIEVMESELKRAGPKYTILESISLK